MKKTTRDEAETTIVVNRYQGTAECCTADPMVAQRWQKVGWPVEVLGCYPDGSPRTWQTTVPWRRAVRFASLKAPKRRAEPPRPPVNPYSKRASDLASPTDAVGAQTPQKDGVSS